MLAEDFSHLKAWGLTGPLASGKSTIATALASHGALIWDADAVVHTLQQANTPITKLVESWQIPDSLNTNGAINRKVLATYLLQHPKKLEALEQITFKLLQKELPIWLGHQPPNSWVIIMAPLLFEAKLNIFCHKIIACTAPLNIRKERARARGMTEKTFAFLASRQMPEAKYAAKSHVTLNTDQPWEKTQQTLRKLLVEHKPVNMVKINA